MIEIDYKSLILDPMKGLVISVISAYFIGKYKRKKTNKIKRIEVYFPRLVETLSEVYINLHKFNYSDLKYNVISESVNKINSHLVISNRIYLYEKNVLKLENIVADLEILNYEMKKNSEIVIKEYKKFIYDKFFKFKIGNGVIVDFIDYDLNFQVEKSILYFKNTELNKYIKRIEIVYENTDDNIILNFDNDIKERSLCARDDFEATNAKENYVNELLIFFRENILEFEEEVLKKIISSYNIHQKLTNIQAKILKLKIEIEGNIKIE
ncbi:MAG: hypothetical protein ACRC5S_03120 [Cetobacterium sp.]